MGDWGFKPYENDEAADWYAVTLKNFDFKKVENAILNFDNKDEGCYEPIRCAAFILQKLCVPYIWYVEDNQPEPKELIQKSIFILEKMATNDNDEWTYLDMWGHELGDETGIVEAINIQIEELKERLKDWK